LCAVYPCYSIGEVAAQLNVCSSTARNLLSQAYERLGVTTRLEGVMPAEKLGLLPSRPHDL
jgi:DNA-binding NarL/FixJ family response regulator